MLASHALNVAKSGCVTECNALSFSSTKAVRGEH